MAVPKSKDARLFCRCAFQRFGEAEVLLRAAYTTGAVYLAGYAIECILKALVITAVPVTSQAKTLKSFRAGKAHEYEWLRRLYLPSGGERLPANIARRFTLVNDWSTDLRYPPHSVRGDDAEAFLESPQAIIKWAD